MVNEWGFPIETCPRCLGSGHYSFNPVDGTKCYGCNGKGTQVSKRAQQAFADWQWQQHQHSRPPAHAVQVGDYLMLTQNGKRFRFAVTAIDADNDHLVFTVECNRQATTLRAHRLQTLRRIGTVDPAPFLATIDREQQ